MGNCYIVGCEETAKAAVIDPGAEPERILEALKKSRLKPVYIVNTHGHPDHVSANAPVKRRTSALILIHELDASLLSSPRLDSEIELLLDVGENSPPPDRLLKDGETIRVGKVTFQVLHTPGHTPGSICLLAEGSLFTGDTLFAGSVGRTDLPGGSPEALRNSLQRKLLPLDDGLTVYPGHGPPSTLGYEKKHNLFLKSSFL
jgi:glyoxylase-like metal-dependent hydrolase (beta-lactamase superfamily II)